MEAETYYHVFNRANGSDNLFVAEDNYRFFLDRFRKYIDPIAEIYCYCLMPNHFHFFLKIKDENAIAELIKDRKPKMALEMHDLNLGGYKNLQGFIDKFTTQQFSNLFNSYSKAFNKQQNRIGSLFQSNFKYKKVEGLSYFQALVTYIHCNPIHHGFVSKLTGWNWSSYELLVHNHPSYLRRNEVISWFDTVDNFVYCHETKQNFHLPDNLVFE